MKPIVLIVVLSGLVLGGLVSVNAGSLGYRSVSAYMDWEPDCSKPSQPSFFVTDVDSYNYAVSQFNGYLSEVQLYIGCIGNEAEHDADTMARAIQNGLEEKRTEIVSELDDAKSDLTNQRLFLP